MIGFSVLAAREMEQDPKNERGEGEERKQRFLTFLPHPSPLFYSHHFSRGLVPRSLLRNRTETLATQAT